MTHPEYRVMLKARTQTCPTLTERARLNPYLPGMPSQKQAWCIHCDPRSGWWTRRKVAWETIHGAGAELPGEPPQPNHVRKGEAATLQHLLVCHRSQRRMAQARDDALKAINKGLSATNQWNNNDMEWLNPEGLPTIILKQLTVARVSSHARLSVEREAGDGATYSSTWLSDREVETPSWTSKMRLQTSNRVANWAGIPPVDLRPALKACGASDADATRIWRDSLAPLIANALQAILQDAAEDERAWMQDRARRHTPIHEDYDDEEWPSESMARAACTAARAKITAWGLLKATAGANKATRMTAADEQADFAADMRQIESSGQGRCRKRARYDEQELSSMTPERFRNTHPVMLNWGIMKTLRDNRDEASKAKDRKKAWDETVRSNATTLESKRFPRSWGKDVSPNTTYEAAKDKDGTFRTQNSDKIHFSIELTDKHECKQLEGTRWTMTYHSSHGKQTSKTTWAVYNNDKDHWITRAANYDNGWAVSKDARVQITKHTSATKMRSGSGWSWGAPDTTGKRGKEPLRGDATEHNDGHDQQQRDARDNEADGVKVSKRRRRHEDMEGVDGEQREQQDSGEQRDQPDDGEQQGQQGKRQPKSA